MTTRYVGIGGDNGWDGLAWVSRKLTLNGVEDTPVAATDIVYVGPGVYRELLTLDISGAAGQPITYIGDVTGEHTDGIGGIVRITGSDDDLVAARANCIIVVAARTYRTFQGFMMDIGSSNLITTNGYLCTNWTIQDCTFQGAASQKCIMVDARSINFIIQRCVFYISQTYGIHFSHSVVFDNSNNLVQNCLFVGGGSGVATTRVGGITIKNSTFIGRQGVLVVMALTVGQTVTVNNCIFAFLYSALIGTVAGEIVENYNTFWGNGTDRTLTNIGANSVAYPPLYNPFLQLAGFRYPSFVPLELSIWSQVRARLGTAEATDDLLGMTRPVTAAKDSWGAVQYADVSRSSVQAHGGTYSAKFADAGRKQFIIPVTAINTTFSVYVYREANYAGVNPQMIIKQPGVADTTVLDAGAAGGWNQLTTVLASAALPPYVIVELVSNNTAVAGAYNTYFDDLTVN